MSLAELGNETEPKDTDSVTIVRLWKL